VLNPLLFSQKEMKHFLGHGRESLSSAVPGSPVAKRTKHEIRCAQKLARKHSISPILWAKCLLGTCYRYSVCMRINHIVTLVCYCYSLWFIHLPSHVIQSQFKAQCLQTAYDLLEKMHKLKVQLTDEVIYIYIFFCKVTLVLICIAFLLRKHFLPIVHLFLVISSHLPFI
jgi:hypothetical protein